MFTGGKAASISKRISVLSNDPNTPRCDLTLNAEVVEDIKISPPSVNFGDVVIGKKATRMLTLDVLRPETVAVESVTCDDARFVPKKIKADHGGAEWEVTFLGGDTKGTVEPRLTLRTRGTGYAHIEVPMWVNLVGAIHHPHQIFFFRQNGVYPTQTVRLESRVANAPFTVTDVSDPEDRFRFEVVQKTPTTTLLKLTLKDPAKPLSRSLLGTVQIRSTEKTDPLIKIKYTVVHRNR